MTTKHLEKDCTMVIKKLMKTGKSKNNIYLSQFMEIMICFVIFSNIESKKIKFLNL